MTARAVSVPSPTDVLGPIQEAIGKGLAQGAGSVMDGLGGWLFSSLGELTGSVFSAIDRSSSPNVLSAWFINGSTGVGPYRAMATVAATILGVLAFGGIVQGVAQGDVGGMVKRMAINLPVAVVGIGGTVVVVQVLIDLTDSLSRYLTSTVADDTHTFVSSIQDLANNTGSVAAPSIILGLVMLVAALVVFIELLVRSLLIYLIVALCPLAWAALVWPVLQGALRKTLELLIAVILSKVVVALAIAVGAAALSATAMSGAAAPELAGYRFAEPGVAASTSAPISDPSSGGLVEGLGLLATGVATLALAAFSPFLIARLLPFAEAAVVAQGTRGAPMRAGQQAWNMKYQLDVARRFGGRSSGGSASSLGGSAGLGSPAAGGGGSSGSSGLGGVGATGGGAAGGVAGPASAGGGAGAASAATGPAGIAVAAGASVAKSGGAAWGHATSAVASQSAPPSSGSGSAPSTPDGSGSAIPSHRPSSTRFTSQPETGTGPIDE